MKLTIVYDNEAQQGLKSDWGFAALVEHDGAEPILFDTGADGSILLYNMKKLAIDPASIASIVISHPHYDHTGGLADILEINTTASLYLPSPMKVPVPENRVTVVREAKEIAGDIYSTGQLEGIEQALALKTERGIFVVTGCAHPSMSTILDAAANFGEVYGIAGGFHAFRDFRLFEHLSLIYPCHCTQHKKELHKLFPDTVKHCEAGMVIKV